MQQQLRSRIVTGFLIIGVSSVTYAVPNFGGNVDEGDVFSTLLALLLFIVGIPVAICIIIRRLVLPPNLPYRKDFWMTLYSTCWTWMGALTTVGVLVSLLPGHFMLLKLLLVIIISFGATVGAALHSFRAERTVKKGSTLSEDVPAKR
jgi:hypothetical protein